MEEQEITFVPPNADVPFLEDVMMATKTTRADWLLGQDQIHQEMGVALTTFRERAANGELPVLKVMAYGRHGFMYIAKKADVAAWKVERDRLAAEAKAQWEKEKAEKQAADAVTKGPKAKPASETNGRVAVNEVTGQNVLVLKEGVPLLSTRDAEAIMRAMWDEKLATQANTRAVESLSYSVDELKKEVIKLRVAVEPTQPGKEQK